MSKCLRFDGINIRSISISMLPVASNIEVVVEGDQHGVGIHLPGGGRAISPDEARAVADSLVQAAELAESFFEISDSEVDELVAEIAELPAEEHNAVMEMLDDAVHELAGVDAANINNSGVETQVRMLVSANDSGIIRDMMTQAKEVDNG